MGRLTERQGADVAYIGQHTQLPGLENASTMRVAAVRDVMQRLADYEDTGVAPEQIKKKQPFPDDALEVIKPAPDSHFRLLPCYCCGGQNVAYVRYGHQSGDLWRVQCFDCDEIILPGKTCRHEVQVQWNKCELRRSKNANI